MDPAFEGKTEPCTVFAVSSYKGHYPTFKILLKNGSLFDYIPAHALLVGTTSPVHNLTLGDLCYFKACPDMNITVNVHATLAGSFCKRVCWMPRTAAWINITQYICTIDWFQDNHNAHLVVLENGQVAFVPNHKVLPHQANRRQGSGFFSHTRSSTKSGNRKFGQVKSNLGLLYYSRDVKT
mgnify:CR=1 FL=1